VGERVLFVCTANQCRSPLAAALLTARAPALVVQSAGVQADGVSPATPSTIDAGRALHVDLQGHRTRRLDAAMVQAADLVVGMERQHVREAAILAPGAFARSFTLKELVRRGTAAGPRVPTETLPAWLGRVNSGRRPVDMLGTSRDDDLEDPTADPLIDHGGTARAIDELVASMVDLIWANEL
jgi:protein-tyrosine phosphatase